MAVDINLLKSLIGDTDPLYNIYQDQGLFDEGNIVPYSEDVRWEDDPAGLTSKKERTAGYTYTGNIGPMSDPEYDTRLFIKGLDKFKKPQAPLYNAPGLASGLDKNAWYGRDVGVDKFGNTLKAPQSWMNAYVKQAGPGPGTYSPSGLWEGRSYSPIWDAPTITEKNKELAGTIGHEARHQLLGQNPEFFQDIDPSYVINEEDAESDYGAVDRHELLNRMLDFQANQDTGIYNDIYGTKHGNMPRHLSSPIADKYSDQATAFTNYMKRNPRRHVRDLLGINTAKQMMAPGMPEHLSRDTGAGNIPTPKKTYVSPARPHGNGGGYEQSGGAQGTPKDQPGGQIGGLGGHGPARWAYGGRVDKLLSGRSRDI